MIVATQYKHLILNPPDPRMITEVIPTARIATWRGHQVVTVPHRIDEVRVLNNLGFNAPSPITFYHEWKAPFDAFEAQRITAGMLTLNPRAYVCNELGTGKTQAVLWAISYLLQVRKIRRALICCTLSTIERVWADEIFSSFAEMGYVSLHSSSAERRIKLLNEDAHVYIINHDGIKIPKVLDALHKRQDIDLVVIDELAEFRNSRTDRYRAMEELLTGRAHRGKRIVRVGPGKPWVWGLTAKPTPNDPTDAWAQCKLITPNTVPEYFRRFRDEVMIQRGPYTWEPRKDAEKVVAHAMRPAVRFKRSQCYDMVETQYETRHAEMSAEQKALYQELRKELVAQYEGGQIKAFNEAVKIAKLVQVASGVVYSTTGEELQVPCGPRLDVLTEVCEEAAAKVIIFAPFKCTIRMLVHEREKLGKRVAMVHGEVGKHERDQIFAAFQRGQLDELIAQPGAMAHGLTLTAADTVIWFAPIDSNVIYEQANGRITRPSQHLTPVVVHIEGSPAERTIYKRLEKKQKLQNLLLDIMQTEL